MFLHAREALGKLFAHHPGLVPNFTNSIFPAVTYNCGPNTACLEHIDHGNAATMMCLITAVGDYNYRKGGHLVLHPIKRFYQFPPGTTAMIPSALLAHGNTPVMRGETRMSITQYCSGGLLRWVAYGFKTVKTLLAEPGGADRKREIDGPPGARWAWALGLFSTLDQLLRGEENDVGSDSDAGSDASDN